MVSLMFQIQLPYAYSHLLILVSLDAVAVAGLPNPQEDHAIRMTRFSHECMAKMSLVVRDLTETLGEDTADLQLRVGLHSGPVTAGVLRGGKINSWV